MDFDAAIVAHSKWKDRIRKSLAGGERLDPKMVGLDNQCDLGKWIESAGLSERGLPEFSKLREVHTRFHKVAAETITKAAGVSKEEGDKLVTGASTYGVASSECIRAIGALRDRVKAGKS